MSNHFCQKVEIFLANDQSDAFSSVFRFSCCFFFEGGVQLDFSHPPLQQTKTKGEEREQEERQRERMRPVLNLVQTPQAATIKGISCFYQGLPARLLWQFNPLPIYKQQQKKNGGSESDGQRELECDNKKRGRKTRERPRECCHLNSCLTPTLACFATTLRDFSSAVIHRASSGETGVAFDSLLRRLT